MAVLNLKSGSVQIALALSLSSLSSNAFGVATVTKGFDLKHCNSITGQCIRLTAREAEQSVLSSIYVLTDLKLETPSQSLDALDGYYDSTFSRIIVRGVKDKNFSEASYNISTDELSPFR